MTPAMVMYSVVTKSIGVVEEAVAETDVVSRCMRFAVGEVMATTAVK